MKPLLMAPAVTLLALAGSAFAQAPNVAIVAAASGSLSDCRYTDVQSYLLATGSFSNVSVIDCVTQTPTVADLAPFDAIVTWTNVDYADKELLGDVLADYADTGAGVVVAVFANTTTGTNRFLGGRWVTGGYEIILPAQGNSSNAASLGTILDPTHPTVQGVTTLSATSAFRPNIGTPLVQGQVVAEWDDGATLVATGTMPNRVDLGLYPPSNNCAGTFWDFAGDGDVLLANALLYSVAGAAPGSNYCSANINSTGVAASMGAAGSPAVSANDLTLSARDLPMNSFCFFITSETQGFVPNPGGSSGDLCLGGNVGRYVGPGQVQQAGSSGSVALTIDLTATPQPMGFVSITAGQTWNFQAWYRDVSGGATTSNFTDGYSIGFQ